MQLRKEAPVLTEFPLRMMVHRLAVTPGERIKQVRLGNQIPSTQGRGATEHRYKTRFTTTMEFR
ncbi:MAG: hypothetical protein QG608_1821 [Actinomycetota bacterium]|nr:hypothetical protein [Actinomycetota bacterium]